MMRSDGQEGFVPAGFIYPLDAIQKQRKLIFYGEGVLNIEASEHSTPQVLNTKLKLNPSRMLMIGGTDLISYRIKHIATLYESDAARGSKLAR